MGARRRDEAKEEDTERKRERVIVDGGGSRYQIESGFDERPRREDGVSAVGRSR